ncbi:MAG: potassium channel protein [Bacteroidetes bacterium]|nr:potassium channel protein [Bacteroidota bacterium]MCY4204741.1 potassium channel protein [Bacteroidota bacterium]
MAPFRRWQLRERTPQRLEVAYSISFLFFLFVVGTFGYRYLEDWTLIDGLYMSFITLTTIGFSEVDELSDAGRIFTMVIGIIGIGSVGVVTYRWARLLVAGTLIRNRRRMHQIKRMKNHYIICGYGRVGKEVTRILFQAHKPLVVLDKDENITAQLNATGIHAVTGDAVHDATLLEAGITKAEGLIILLPDDAQSVYITLVAREKNPDLFILARASDAISRRRILQAGASQVILPVQVGAERIAQVILRPQVDQFMSQVLQAEDLGLGMEEIVIEEGAAVAGKTLSQVDFRNSWETMVVAIIKHFDQKMHFYPKPDDLVEVGDTLIVLGSIEMIEKLAQEGCKPQGKVSRKKS